jgi:hypothetical protein
LLSLHIAGRAAQLLCDNDGDTGLLRAALAPHRVRVDEATKAITE